MNRYHEMIKIELCIKKSLQDDTLYLDIDIDQLERLCFEKRLIPFTFRKDELFFSKVDIDEWLRSLVKKLL
jgi:hypothetical protein